MAVKEALVALKVAIRASGETMMVRTEKDPAPVAAVIREPSPQGRGDQADCLIGGEDGADLLLVEPLEIEQLLEVRGEDAEHAEEREIRERKAAVGSSTVTFHGASLFQGGPSSQA